MNFVRFLTITLAIIPFVDARADGDIESGEKLYAVCAGCHGFLGQGNQLIHAPKISGQEAWYLQRQISNFMRGVRGSSENDTQGRSMALMTKALESEADISDVVAFISTLPDKPTDQVIQGNVSNGKKLYEACGACHGNTGEGNVVFNAPALVGMNDWYQLSQLINYKNGLRGTHPADIYGQQMAPMAALLTDEAAMRDVVAYINSLQ